MSTSFKSFALAALLLGLAAAPARAEEVARLDVPFPFLVNGKTLPAGQYDVRSDTQDASILMIQGLNGSRPHAIVSTIPDYGRDPSGDQPVLMFVRQGNQYRLTKIWESRDYARDVIGR